MISFPVDGAGRECETSETCVRLHPSRDSTCLSQLAPLRGPCISAVLCAHLMQRGRCVSYSPLYLTRSEMRLLESGSL